MTTPTASRSWQAILYGRTVRADRWWRVRPGAVDARWLDSVVTAGVAGGNELADGPRLVLVRYGATLVIGAAARADLLHETMNSDGNRPLYCFVGWLTRDPAAGVPELDAFAGGWREWAREVYASWMPLDWQRHPTDLGVPHEPPLERAPWAGLPAVARGSENLPADLSRLRRDLPAEAASGAWHALLASPHDFGLAIGLPRGADGSGVFSHVVPSGSAADGPEAPAPTRQAAAPHPADTGLPETHVDPWDATPPNRRSAPPHRHPAPEQPVRAPAETGFIGGFKKAVRSLLAEPDERAGPDPTAGGPTGPAGDVRWWQGENAASDRPRPLLPKRKPPDDPSEHPRR